MSESVVVPTALELIQRLEVLERHITNTGSSMTEKEMTDASTTKGCIAELLMWHHSRGFHHPVITNLLETYPQLHDILNAYKSKPVTAFKPKSIKRK
jgi:hypothetical protein